ncbi:hypothetical protein KHQ07_04465 [Pseudochrobactrum algeriensis]|nr:hypothetical protein [Pseudochrobactrum algeriensis]QVQ40838.1 hypothetical protein KHQ07_04465 [Pseudochrobactrum algeriensis]
MIRSMVDGLAAKLQDNPTDIDGWERLLRAYVVLGERDNAAEALRKAVKVLPENDRKRLTQVASRLGLDTTGVQK